MGFFAKVFGWGKGDGRFVSEKAFRKNLANQVSMTSQTLEQLYQYEVMETTKLKLEYFFYTDSTENASVLAAVLTEKDYSVEHGPSADGKTFVITGWTTPMLMNGSTVVEWTKEMCNLGFEHDCEFDGWGTNPNQD